MVLVDLRAAPLVRLLFSSKAWASLRGEADTLWLGCMLTPEISLSMYLQSNKVAIYPKYQKPQSSYCILPSQSLTLVSSASFLILEFLSAPGSSLSLYNEWHSNHLQPKVAANLAGTSRILGPLALSMRVNYFLGWRGNSAPLICLGLGKWNFKGVQKQLGSLSKGNMWRWVHILGLLSLYPILVLGSRNTGWCPRANVAISLNSPSSRMSLFHFHSRRIFSLNIEFWIDESPLSPHKAL